MRGDNSMYQQVLQQKKQEEPKDCKEMALIIFKELCILGICSEDYAQPKNQPKKLCWYFNRMSSKHTKQITFLQTLAIDYKDYVQNLTSFVN